MPKRQISKLELECDFCGEKDQFDLTADPSTILPRLAKWRGILEPTARSEPQGIPASTKWYDSVDCLCKGAKHDEESAKLEAALGKACEGPMLAG